jgi:hypothetical protein
LQFPATNVLDDFNSGASQSLNARAGWSTTEIYNAGDSTFVTDATPTKAVPSISTPASNFWGTIIDTPDMECWWKTANTSQSGSLVLRYNHANVRGYRALVSAGGNHEIRTLTGTLLASGSFGSTVIGDTYGFLIVGQQMQMWKNGTVILAAGDSTYRNGGSIGFQTDAGNTPQLDQFGGGALAQSITIPGRGQGVFG